MAKPRWNRAALSDPSWRHWAITIPLLVGSLAGSKWALCAALLLCALVGAYFWTRLRRIRPYPVQVRIAYVIWLSAGALPGMQWMHWIQLLGTTAMATVGYCPLVRLLSLLPFNRTEPLTFALVERAFFVEPRSGGLIDWSGPSETAPAICCSLPTARPELSCQDPAAWPSPDAPTQRVRAPRSGRG